MNLQTLTLSTLKPAPYNPRKISEDAMGRLEKSVKEWGIVDPLIVNKATGYTIIGGHQRFKVLQKQGVQTADCVVLDLPPAKEKALNIALNNQKMAGEYEFSTLADILQEIDTGEFSVPDLTGFSEEDLTEIANWTPEETDMPLLSSDEPGFQQMTFILSNAQVEIVKEAVQKAKVGLEETGENKNPNGNALSRIAGEFCGKG